MNGPRRLLVVSLLILLVLLIVYAQIGTIWAGPRAGVDLQIPLLATERWLAGGEPYQAAAFGADPGQTQPFLYPPFVLPFLAPLTSLPRSVVLWTWVAILFVAAIYTIRRLHIPWLWVPLVFAWPPFTEGVLDGNVVMLMFLAFVVLFYRATGIPWRPDPRDVSLPTESTVEVGALSTFTGALKVSQPHAWLFVLHYRWRAAVLGAVAMAVLVLATLPTTGIDLWFDWFAQLRRASDTTWDLGGFALPRFLPAPWLGTLVAIWCIVAVWFVPKRDGAPWVGILSTFGSLSLHIFGLLFLVPAMLKIRLELALIAACFIATYSYEGCWAGIMVVTVSYAVRELASNERVRAWMGDTMAVWR
jgi:hypothetical protein